MLTQSKVYIIKLSFSLRRTDNNVLIIVVQGKGLSDENRKITQKPSFKSVIKIRSDLIERFYILEESFYSCLFYRCDVGVSTF